MFFTKKAKTILVFFFMLWATISYSNNITITDISLSNKNTVEKYVFFNFNIGWDNSWRIDTGSKNWDKAWIFVKFRTNGGYWMHATLSLTDRGHIVPTEGVCNISNHGKGAFFIAQKLVQVHLH